MMLIRRIYVSRAMSRTKLDFGEILAGSRRANGELGITGIFLYLDEVLIQYLEREESPVDALFRSIKLDSRHQAVTCLGRQEIKKRVFPEWAMALLEWTPETKAIFHSFSPGTNLDLYAGDPETTVPLIKAFSRAPGWKVVVGKV